MTANFNDAAINAVLDRIVSFALATGRFEQVNQHEPKNGPGNGLTCAIWVQRIRPVRSSGLAATSGVIILNARLYTNFKSAPFDYIDPNLTAASTDFMGALSGDFQLDDNPAVASVREIDLLGMEGQPLEVNAGYLEMDRQMYRVMTVTIPVVINDMFTQVA